MAQRVLMKGNEAIAEAAIRAGCRHYFGYPITPQTEIAAYMAKKMGYPYLMSDDGGAKLLVNAFLRKPQVMDVYTALMTCHENGTEITLKQLNPTIANVFRDKREKLKLLQERYS